MGVSELMSGSAPPPRPAATMASAPRASGAGAPSSAAGTAAAAPAISRPGGAWSASFFLSRRLLSMKSSITTTTMANTTTSIHQGKGVEVPLLLLLFELALTVIDACAFCDPLPRVATTFRVTIALEFPAVKVTVEPEVADMFPSLPVKDHW